MVLFWSRGLENKVGGWYYSRSHRGYQQTVRFSVEIKLLSIYLFVCETPLDNMNNGMNFFKIMIEK